MSQRIVFNDEMRAYFASLPTHIQDLVLKTNLPIQNQVELMECVERLMREKEADFGL